MTTTKDEAIKTLREACVAIKGEGSVPVPVLRIVMDALAASQAAPAKAEGWISCDTALPDDNQTVAILYWPYDNRENAQIVGAAIHIDGTFYNHEGEDHHPPSHWCAIPAAPSTPAKEPT